MLQWYVVQTKPHKEFMARDALSRIDDVQVYLPILRVNPVNPRARKRRPFFPGYMFVHIDLADVGISAIQWMPGLVRMLGTEGEPCPIPADVVEGIRNRVQESQQEQVHGGASFRQGDIVRITSGPFESFEGMFDTALGGKTRARILVEFLGRLTSTEVDVRSLEKVSKRRS